MCMIYEQCNYSILLLLYDFEMENVEIKQTWRKKNVWRRCRWLGENWMKIKYELSSGFRGILGPSPNSRPSEMVTSIYLEQDFVRSIEETHHPPPPPPRPDATDPKPWILLQFIA